MCVIIHKLPGVSLPDVETIEKCWDANPDGAGFMFIKGKEVVIAKGFFKWNQVKDFLPYLTKKMHVAIHFRIATHGGKGAGNCHPFPISNDSNLLMKRSLLVPAAMMHNGIISSVRADKVLSDSQVFVKDVLSNMNVKDFFKSGPILQLISMATAGSRLLFLQGNGGYARTGVWEKDKNGVYYSNMHWDVKPQQNYNITWPAQGKNSYNWLDDRDDYEGMWQDELAKRELKEFENRSCKQALNKLEGVKTLA